jgi:hypothetical protein
MEAISQIYFSCGFTLWEGGLGGHDSVTGIVIRYGLDGSGFEFL